MKYTVKCSCGHDVEVNLYGKASEREAKIKWYETEAVCPECYKAKKASEVVEIASANSLCKLVGSEKQVKWANEIRAKLFAEIDDIVSKSPASTANATKIKEWLKTKTEAKFYIDNRDDGILTITRKYRDETNKH